MQIDVKSELVRSTAFLRREFLGRDRFKKRSNTIYIFDTDVIKASCAPWVAGPGIDQGGNGYGEPVSFLDPEKKKIRIDQAKRKQKAERVSHILANHGLGLSGEFPIYQFQPHFEKCTEIYGYVRNDAERAGRRTDQIAQKDRARRSIIQLSALIASRQSDGTSHELTFEADLLTQILNNSVFGASSDDQKAVREWDSFVELNTKYGGVFPISHAAQHFRRKAEANYGEEDRFAEVAKVIEGFGLDALCGQERTHFHKLKEFWMRSREWSDEAKRESNSNYSACLALLGLMNVRLAKVGWRAVFVTGSTNLVDASYGTISSEAQSILGDVSDDFGNRFVRHIWAYTSEALIEPHNQTKFVNWLDGLLGKWAGKSSFQTTELTNLRSNRRFEGVTLDDAREAFESWDDRTSKMVAQHNFFAIGQRTEDLKEKLIARIQTSRSEKLSWTQISNLLMEENDRDNDEAFLVFSNIGVDALISAQKTSRHPPDLDFESLSNTKKIFAKLTSNEGYKTRQQFEADIEAIKDDCFPPEQDNRQYSHLCYLALGAAFASASRWSVALSQAQRAIRIIERSKDRGLWPIPKRKEAKSHMSGREAYFLAAVSLRMISKHPKDFETSGRFLKKAYEALVADRGVETAKNFDELRFLNEECAHALSLYYFNRMKDEANFQDQRFEDAVDSLERALKSVKFLQTGTKLKNRRAATLAHVALNTIQAHAIKAYREREGQSSPDREALAPATLRNALSMLETLAGGGMEQNARLFKTKLMTCYGLVGSILVNGSSKHTKKEVSDAFKGWESTVVTDYDRWRYLNLRTLADGLITKR